MRDRSKASKSMPLVSSNSTVLVSMFKVMEIHNFRMLSKRVKYYAFVTKRDFVGMTGFREITRRVGMGKSL